MTETELSVVIPAFNEEGRLRKTLETVAAHLRELQIEFEIIVVDDGSSDGTVELANEFFAGSPGMRMKVLSNGKNRGKGFSVRRGFLEVAGGLALLTDADLSTPISELGKLWRSQQLNDCDVALGSRDIDGSVVSKRQSWIRENSGKLFNRAVRLLTLLPYRDTQCGFKLFRMSTCRDIFARQTLDRYAFDVEILFIARKWGLKVAEVPVVWGHSPGSKVHLVQDGMKMLWDLLRIHSNNLRGLYTRN